MTDTKRPDDERELAESSLLTRIQHAGARHRVGRGLVSATEISVTFWPETPDGEPIYQRLSNTANNREVCAVLASLFGADDAFVTCSGMAALNLILATELTPGSEIVCQEDCYGATRGLLEQVLSRWGVTARFCPAHELARAFGPKTRAVLCETISNPFCKPLDVAPICEAARARGVVSIVDNTFASPFNCRPTSLGADYVWESATKYLNGHSDQVAGVIAASRERIHAIAQSAIYLGCFLDSDGCVRLLRGLRTFGLRMQRHNDNGAAFAAAMRTTPGVAEVYYGDLDVKAQAAGQRLAFDPGFGGMVCLRFEPRVDVITFCAALRWAADVPSLGGTETTVCMPLHTSHKWIGSKERERLGVTSQVLRVSVGLESVADTILDFRQALKTCLA